MQLSRSEINRAYYDEHARGLAPVRLRPAGELAAKKQPLARRASFAFLERRLLAHGLAGKRVLDYGCGAGDLAIFLAAHGAHVTGIDISPDSVRLARAKAERYGFAGTLAFEVGDCERLSLPGGAFDLVISQGVLAFVEPARALREIARVLAPAGRAMIADTLGHHPLANAFRAWRARSANAPERAARRIVTREAWELFARTFARVELHYFDLATVPLMPLHGALGRAAPLLAPTVAAAQALDRLVLSLPALQPYAFRFVAILEGPRRQP